ncbi:MULTISPECIES: copper homeostasis protein CutC [Enterococcus]|uniref:PF03932 family protein CutC n=1 Tax=Enterococcus mundtii TaxID=53346 RepID=A0ABQ0VD49_ENTMU|nr:MULTISPECIES: copper homeostasis protein CutC [Enterococcus]GEN18280.1 copper homeostasis protein CutC [Ligilactobacillus acidipiscis]AUB53698.1 copper homeostasis protein CutC [Enterococcus mundtii]MZZ59706.1 copper homeostasis protein CutC [Enterococcus mundtii]MZZ62861.1 copper homeostasis protein CutC [Enterococcus mundtii]MZZ69768.1 copper homeostasis protein CutC [Enterococcus mundtii]
MIKEFCAENYTSIPLAIANGANRIELCDNLAVGGTTPSTGVIEEVLSYANEKSVPVMTIIRPRGGDFVYNDIELKIMHTDLIEAKKLGTDGVVIGCLTPSGWLDEEALEVLIDSAEGLQITFHMAFDAIPQERQYEAIDWLVEHGVHRILTHGGVAGTNIEDNFAHLKQLITHADGRIIILPGGGITSENAQVVADALEVHEVHGTKIVPLSE